MSFMLTKEQFKDGSKTETRRMGWWFLEHGDLVQGVEKGMGLKRGEKVVKLGLIYIIATIPEKLCEISQESVRREGFPDKSPEWFIDFFCRSHKGCTPEHVVNRIIFKHCKGYLCEQL